MSLLPEFDIATATPVPGHSGALFAPGVAGHLGAVLTGMGARRVMVIHGHGSFHASGAGTVVAELSDRFVTAHFDQVTSNPDLMAVTGAVAAIEEFGPDVVVGIGGGSALDVAKVAALLAAQKESVRDCVIDSSLITQRRELKLVLLPTTSGSGSEVTRFATVYLGRMKHQLENVDLRSDVSLIDPELTGSASTSIAVACSLDALCHAVEAYWSVSATQDARETALLAISSMVPALRRALGHKGFDDTDVRAQLSWGSTLSGVAIDRTGTTAADALSYALTSRFGTPHGVSVALHVKWMAMFNADANDSDCRHPEGSVFLFALMGKLQERVRERSGAYLHDLIAELLDLGGYPTKLEELHWPVPRVPALIGDSLTSPQALNSPRVVTEAAVIRAFQGENRTY